ncbi:MAG: hypothetical protein JW715_02865 [Sedimentisphaerales bacterium]|nr:hypothetical protein [Sedimentisphaerales bacterium]
MNSFKSIPVIFLLVTAFTQIRAEKLQAQPPMHKETNDNRGIVSEAAAHISLVLVEEGRDVKSYRWGLTRRKPLQVIQGWYAFDDKGIVETQGWYSGGRREIASARPMQLSLTVSRKDGYLVFDEGYDSSSTTGDRQAENANGIQWPAGAELKSYYLSEPAVLTNKLHPLWKGDFLQNEKVLKSVVYAVRVDSQNAPGYLFDVGDTSELLRIGRAWSPVPNPAKLIFQGKTIDQWIGQWNARVYDETQAATRMLTKIGRPVVPAMLEIIKQGGPHAGRASTVLGKMGPEAEEALDWLIDTALGKNSSESSGNIHRNVVICLCNMTWAAERLLPVFTTIAEDTEAEITLRRLALSGLQNMGEQAMPVLQRFADAEPSQMREQARGAISRILDEQGKMSREEYYTQLVEKDPFDPGVPRYLTSTKGIVNSGRSHALTEKVKALHRQRLKENPDPGLAWNLVQIIQNGLRNTELEWAAPTDSSSGRSDREDPAESFSTLAKVLELGFMHAQTDSELRKKFGYALAKLRLLQGDWDRMNAVLKQMGQQPIPAESQPWLTAPPDDWAEDFHLHWQVADESMRSGNCGLEFRIEKEGKGLKGAHVLVKKAPEPTRGFSTGIAADTLFLAPYPVGDDRFSFGYRGGDRGQTRYAVSDDSGIVLFEKLPEIPIKIEVLIPTSNFPETGRNWDLWIEVEPGQFKIARIFGADYINPREPPAVVTLKPGRTVCYPRLVVRPAFELNVMDMDRVDKDSFILNWEGLDATLQDKVAHYELEMSLSSPSQTPRLVDGASSTVHSAREILNDTQWPVGSKGVGELNLEPGNIYIFEVKAIDDANTVIARWPKTRIWVPWQYRRTNPPLSGINTNLEDNSPIYHGVWFRGTFRHGDGREETLPERVERFIREQPEAFERDYVRMGKAWLDWHTGDIEGAKQQLERLIKELPKGNLARGTCVWLLQQINEKKEPPKRLEFVPDRE